MSLIFLSSCEKDEPTKGGISGKVILEGTQMGISGISISLSGLRSLSTSTNDLGQFSFTELPVGEYSVTATAPSSYQVVAAQTIQVRSNQIAPLSFSLRPKGSISGKITDANTSTAIEGAAVQLTGGPLNQNESKITASDGNYTFTALADGEYTISISHPDYSDATQKFTISSGSQVTGDFSLQKASGSLGGRITISGTQIGVTGVTVSLNGTQSKSQSTDDEGNFLFEDLPVGEYTLTFGVPSSFQNISPIIRNVESGQLIEVDVSLTPKGEISGQITGEDKPNGIAGAQIKLSGGPTNLSLSEVSDAQGNYSFSNLADGTYLIEVSHPDYASGSLNLSLTDGNRINGDITLTKSRGSLGGRVTIINTQIPVSGVRIVLSGSMNTSTTTDDQGTYSFPNIPVGAYKLNVEVSSSYQPISELTVNIAADQETKADISLTPKGGVTGKITQEGTTTGIAGAEVKLSGGPTNDTQSRVTDISGQYSFTELLNGSYRIDVSHPNFVDASRDITVSEGKTVNRDIAMGILGPSKEVTPTTLDFGLYNNKLSFSIKNKGRAELVWGIGNENNELTVFPLSGNVQAGESQSVSVSLDREGVENGEYSYNIYFTSNDGNQDINIKFIVDNPIPDPCENANITAGFIVENNGCKAPCEISFNNTSVNASRYTWEFGDGNMSESAFPKNVFRTPKSFNVKLKAFNEEGCADSLIQPVNINWETFEAIFDVGGFEVGNAVLNTPDGGYLVAGQTNNVSGTNNANTSLIKLSSAGLKEWDMAFGGGGGERAHDIIPASDGGYILVGESNSSSNGADATDVHVIKVSENGALLWERFFGNASGSGDIGYSVIQTVDGGYLIAGETTFSWSDAYLLKITKDGNKEWEQTYGSPTADDRADNVIATSDGGFLLVGRTFGFGAGFADVFLIKTSGTGAMQWQKTYGGGSSDWGTSIISGTNGGYLIIGSTQSAGNGSYDFYLVKITEEGSVQWEKTFGGAKFDYAYSGVSTSDGGYLIVGDTNSKGAGDYDVYLVKISVNGSLQWEKNYSGSSQDFCKEVTDTPDGGFIIVGSTDNGEQSNSYTYIIKTDNQGIVQ